MGQTVSKAVVEAVRTVVKKLRNKIWENSQGSYRRSNKIISFRSSGEAVGTALGNSVGIVFVTSKRRSVDALGQELREAVGKPVRNAVGYSVENTLGKQSREPVQKAVGTALGKAV